MDTPEHDKLKAIKDQSETVGQFMDWLMHEKKVQLCVVHEHTDHCWEDNELCCGAAEDDYVPFYYGRMEDLLAEYFEIDLKKLEAEKVETMRKLREIHENKGR